MPKYTDWDPARWEEDTTEYGENDIDKHRLPSFEQNAREMDPLRIVMARSGLGAGQLFTEIDDRLDNWFLSGFPISWEDWVALSSATWTFATPPTDFKTDGRHLVQWNAPNVDYARSIVPLSSSLWDDQGRERMMKLWLEHLREAVDSIIAVKCEPAVGYSSPTTYDPDNPEFPWTQPISGQLLSWEREIVEQRIAADCRYAQLLPQGWVPKELTGFAPTHIGPWPAAPFTYYPYPEGPPTPASYNPCSEIDLAATASLFPTVPGAVGRFWYIGYHILHEEKSTYFGEVVSHRQTAASYGPYAFGPIGFDGIFYMEDGETPINGYLTVTQSDTYVREGEFPPLILTDDDEIVFDDAYLESKIRFVGGIMGVGFQHPRYPFVLTKNRREENAPTPGIKDWFEYFPGFNKSRWPYGHVYA